MLRRLKFIGLVLINIIVALIGTAVLATAVFSAIPSHTIPALFWKESILSVIFAGSIGFGMWRTWRDSAARWTWVLPAAWFVLGLLVTLNNVLRRRSALDSGPNFRAAEVENFFIMFAVPLIRCTAYSVGAYISSRVYPGARPSLPERDT